MKKVIDTKTVKYTTYEKGCPFDRAESMINWFHHMSPSKIYDIIEHMGREGLTEFGLDVYAHLHYKAYGSLDGFGGKPEYLEGLKKRHDEWVAKHNAVDVPKVEKKK